MPLLACSMHMTKILFFRFVSHDVAVGREINSTEKNRISMAKTGR
jgi:hypothetical protein